jgi:hypothetical protein
VSVIQQHLWDVQGVERRDVQCGQSCRQEVSLLLRTNTRSRCNGGQTKQVHSGVVRLSVNNKAVTG